MSSLQEIVLTSVEQYRSEVLRLPQLTRQEERELVQRARHGDQQAKETLLQVVCVMLPRWRTGMCVTSRPFFIQYLAWPRSCQHAGFHRN